MTDTTAGAATSTETTTSTTTTSTETTINAFSLNLCLRILRAIALACFVGVTESAVSVISTTRLVGATSIGLVCFMATLTAVPLGVLADASVYGFHRFVVIYEFIMFGLLLAMGILSALEIGDSHEATQLGFFKQETYFEVEAATALVFLGFAITVYLFVVETYRVGLKESKESCPDVEAAAAGDVSLSATLHENMETADNEAPDDPLVSLANARKSLVR